MKKNLVLLSACAALVSASASHAAVIDDFSDGSLSEYTQYVVNDTVIATTLTSFSSSSGALVASYTATTGVEQTLLLRSDYTLGVGQTMTVDVSSLNSSGQLDFGLAVSSTGTPTAASSADTDTRDSFSWAAVYVRPSQSTVRAATSNNVANTVVSSYISTPSSMNIVAQLYITRTSGTTFDLGYIDTSGTKVTTVSNFAFTSSSVGTAIGFYADLRNTTSIASLDNLTIVPEPSAALLGGLGALSLLRRRRR